MFNRFGGGKIRTLFIPSLLAVGVWRPERFLCSKHGSLASQFRKVPSMHTTTTEEQ